MNGRGLSLIDCCTVIGEITDEAITVTTRSGDVRRLEKGIPAAQRAIFFDQVFDVLMVAGSTGAREDSIIGLCDVAM